MDHEFEFDQLLCAWEEFRIARKAFNKAAKAYDGYSPGWALAGEQSAYDEAKKALRIELDRYIRIAMRSKE